MKTHTGFTLIEVLIAMLLLAVGLLGLAALQTATLRSNLVAYNHGQATQLLYDMSDRIRANSKTAVGSYVVANSNDYVKGKTLNTVCTTTSKPADCTPAIMANNDLIEWNTVIAATLPMGWGSIKADGGVFTLSITWDDDRTPKDTSDDTTLTMGSQL